LLGEVAGEWGDGSVALEDSGECIGVVEGFATEAGGGGFGEVEIAGLGIVLNAKDGSRAADGGGLDGEVARDTGEPWRDFRRGMTELGRGEMPMVSGQPAGVATGEASGV
jgi:hypothetical protein